MACAAELVEEQVRQTNGCTTDDAQVFGLSLC